jgi:DNA-binding beta-propeller fold protein YncE
LYVTDTMNSRIQVFSAEGEVLTRKFGARGLYLGNLVRPKGVAVDGEGNVYVIESYYDSLLVFSGRGEFLLPIGGTGKATGRFYLPSGVWVDTKNRVYVADMFNGRVVLFQFLGGG